MIETVSQLLLISGAVIGASLNYRQAQQHEETGAVHSHLLVISLSCVFIALSGLSALLLTDTDQDTQTLARMLDNLAVYAGLPLISSALLALARGWQWSRAAWGRWLLVLFAMFELCRRSGVGATYSELLMTVTSASWLLAALLLPAAARLAVSISALLASCALLLFGPFSLLDQYDSALYAATLAAALALLGSQSGRLASRT